MEKFIFDTLKSIRENNVVSFHMPGHKNGKLFERLGYDELIKNICMLDTTEIYETDNLHNPKSIIKKSQENAKKILFPNIDNFDLIYLINGSTCGIEASIFCSSKKGDKIILNRGCHQSVYNACIVSDLNPIFIEETISNESIFNGIEEEKYIKIIEENTDAKILVITRPTYYGMSFDIEKIIKKAHEYDMMVIVDEAHGAHLNLNEVFPKSSVYMDADFVIQSLHKTLPSFTQTSILLVNRKRIDKTDMNKLSASLNIFETSSPSYLFLMCIEICCEIYEKYGKKLMDELLNNIYVFKSRVKNFKIYDTSDPTKIYINTIDKGINGYDFSKILRYRYNIQVELSNYSGILMLCSIGNIKADFDSMLNALNDIVNVNIFGIKNNEFTESEYKHEEIKSINKSKKIDVYFPKKIPERKLSPRDAFESKKISVLLEESIGKICGEFVIPYPPGVCIIAPGEVINDEIINFIKESRKTNIEINGMLSCDFSKIQIIV